MAEKKKGGLEDDDLEALLSDSANNINTLWVLDDMQVTTGMTGIPTATVTMTGPDGVSRYVAATGTGPVDAVYKAIDKLIGVSVDLETYGIQAVNEGIDALATTRVSIKPKEDSGVLGAALHSQTGNMMTRQFSGSGSDSDVVVASARAYTSALNKMISWNLRRNEMQPPANSSKNAGQKDAKPLNA